jgi:hypothetical protein
MRGVRNKRGPHIAEIRVNLLNKEKHYISSLEIVRKLRPQIQIIEARYPGLVIQLVEDPPGPPSRAKVLAEIYGTDPIVLREISERLTKEFCTTYDVVKVHDSASDPGPALPAGREGTGSHPHTWREEPDIRSSPCAAPPPN